MKTLVVHLDYIHKTSSPLINVNFSDSSTKPLTEKIIVDLKKIKNISSALDEFINGFYLKTSSPNETKIYSKLKIKGTILFELLFPTKLNLKNFDKIIFSIDKELIFIPFELIYDDNFWCLKYKISRQIKFKSIFTSHRKTKELTGGIISNPTEDKQIELVLRKERENIYNLLKKIKNIKISPPYAGRLIDKKFFINLLLENNIIYFSGHSVSENKTNNFIQLYKSNLKSQDLTNLNLTHIILYFSNSCQSSLVKKSNYFRNTILYSFLQTGIKNYIGNVFNIRPAAAAYFAEIFFKEVYNLKDFGTAILTARRKTLKKYGFKEIAWFSYTFYGDIKTKLGEKTFIKKHLITLATLLLLSFAGYRLTHLKFNNSVKRTSSLNTLAILPLAYYNNNLKDLSLEITDKFYKKFQSKYKLVEREKIKELLKELNLSNSRYADKKNALKIGRIISARYMLYGKIYKMGTRIIVYYRIIDVETSEIEQIKSEEITAVKGTE